jgi:hypothetical protein
VQAVAVVVAALVAVATATIVLVAVLRLALQTLAAALAAPGQTQQLRLVAPVSWWFATALVNFSTGENDETDFEHTADDCGPDRLRDKPRSLLQGR